ncbi:MAG TPA: hypothetical protein VME46_09925 [Acidimicrobiales bacterium]|nr:hypothetical protein [Acidimicrobiales bacterium]
MAPANRSPQLEGPSAGIASGGYSGAPLPAGLVDVKVAALDADWSALAFMWRKQPRPALRNEPLGPG